MLEPIAERSRQEPLGHILRNHYVCWNSNFFFLYNLLNAEKKLDVRYGDTRFANDLRAQVFDCLRVCQVEVFQTRQELVLELHARVDTNYERSYSFHLKRIERNKTKT